MSKQTENTPNTKNQAFTVTCAITGETVKVRKPVFMNRVARVQKLVRSRLGDAVSVAEAVDILTQRYVSALGRKLAGVNFLNLAPTDLILDVSSK